MAGLKKVGIPVFVAIAAAAVVGAALATPGSEVVGTVMARGVFADSTDIKFKITGRGQEVIHVSNAQDTVMQQIVIAPGGHTGWHSHPGPVVVLVKTGALTIYSGEEPICTDRTYVAGQSFVDSGQGHAHIGRNEKSETLELWVTYFDVPPGGVFRNDVDDPGTCVF